MPDHCFNGFSCTSCEQAFFDSAANTAAVSLLERGPTGGKSAEASFKHFVQLITESDASSPEAVLRCVLQGASRVIAALYLPLAWVGHQQRFLHDIKSLREYCKLLDKALHQTHLAGGQLVSGTPLGFPNGDQGCWVLRAMQ
jgi:hypothetical protein